MRAIFISYRREDTEGQAGRLFDDLTRHFGADSVFMDVAGIEPGRDFRRAIDEQVASCGVLLAVIGKGWLDAKDESGRRRLEDPLDFVRLETASALKRDIPVIPVLVQGASLPRAEQLPPDLAELAYRNAVELTHARWDSDVQLLIKALRPYVELRPAGTAGAARPTDEPGPKKSRRAIVATSVTAIAVAVAGYVGYRKATEKAERVSAESTAAPVGAKETASDARPAAEDSAQAGWRYCQKCESMFFDGYPTKGVCPAGGAHSAAGYDFVLPHDISGPGQPDWKFCQKCQSMFFDGYPTKGVCPAGGAHSAAGYNFVLPHVSGPGQADWKFCQKCQSLFFDGRPTKGVCPAGGGHEAAGYNFVLPYR
jgi:hypothetical protein